MSVEAKREKQDVSPLYHVALERYRKLLGQDDDYQSVTEIVSRDDLLNYIKIFEKSLGRGQDAFRSLQGLVPALHFVENFSAMVTGCFGTDAKLTAFIWGSIRLILTSASSADDILTEVLEMLEQLSYALPRLGICKISLELVQMIQAALVDVYTEVICFYARCIHFFRSLPLVPLRRAAWEKLRNDFASTIKRVEQLSLTVNNTADLAYTINPKERKSKRYQNIPPILEPRFWGRENVLNVLEERLSPDKKPNQLKTFALYGMGGVGKSQIALQYVNRHREIYQTILWVNADNATSMKQSFCGIATLLKVSQPGQEGQDMEACMSRIKNWLADTSWKSSKGVDVPTDWAPADPWILVFDNADDLEILRGVWPTSSAGSVLVTTRDATAAQSPASKGFQVQPFDDLVGSEALLKAIGLDTSSNQNREKAVDITKALGGLPLAITQIGSFIAQRKLLLRDFLPLYERNAARIGARKTGISDYAHTLSTVWDTSMKKVEGNAQILLDMLAYFRPDGVDETVLSQGSKSLHEPGYAFLHDDMDLGDAEEVLLRNSLMDKNPEDGVLSMHCLLQAAILRTQSPDARRKIFEIVVRILSWGYTNIGSEDMGYQFQPWANCEKCVPHVHHLVVQREKYKIDLACPQEYGELLLQCSWYLFERECYGSARSLIIAALETFEDKSTLSFASATDLNGLFLLDMNNPEKALLAFEEALEIRRKLLGPSDGTIASSLDNIALALTAMGQLDKAHATNEEAIDLRLGTHDTQTGNSNSNQSNLLLKMNKPGEVEEIPKNCPSLTPSINETLVKTESPRASGDMVLLSRIQARKDRLDETLRLITKAFMSRKRLPGSRERGATDCTT